MSYGFILHIYISYSFLVAGLVKLLLEQRAAVNTSDAVLHETPLMEAAGTGHGVEPTLGQHS